MVPKALGSKVLVQGQLGKEATAQAYGEMQRGTWDSTQLGPRGLMGPGGGVHSAVQSLQEGRFLGGRLGGLLD